MTDDGNGDDFQERVFRAYENNEPRPDPGWKPRVVGGRDAKGPFEFHHAVLPEAESLPVREWLYGTHLVRGQVTVLVAAGGSGKTTLVTAMALALASKRPLLGDYVFERVPVAVVNLDDDLTEMNRRVAAAMIRHRVKREELDGWLFLNDGEERGLTMAKLAEDGRTVLFPDFEAVVAGIQKNGIGVLVIDPFVQSHGVSENSNDQMNQAVAAWRRVARLTGCAIILVHHVRKGAAADIDASRGAKALTDAARVGLVLAPMSEEEADEFGIKPDDAWQYVRLDNAKRNMSPGHAARWFKLEEVQLGNTNVNPLYPNGDSVQAIVPWSPQTVWQRTSTVDINRVLDAIDAGPEPGSRFTLSRRGGGERWVGNVIMQMLGVPQPEATRMLEAWVQSGQIFTQEYRDAGQRKERQGVFVRASRPS